LPKRMIDEMKRGGVRNPYALLNAAGYREGDSEEAARAKLSEHQKALAHARRKRRLSRRER